VHRVFTPDSKSVEESLIIIKEAKKAAQKGIGVIVVDGKMVDEPIVKKAEKILELAAAVGMLRIPS
jgi:citrate lyase subunit beta/citryl-CoA lyase